MNEISQTNVHLEYKKIAKRFLKELGLYNAWLVYISEKNLCRYNWFKKSYLDAIFGQTSFTAFLKEKYGAVFSSTISDIFRYYIRFNEIQYPVEFSLRPYEIKDVERDLIIDNKNKKIRLSKKVWINSIGNETGN